jgi:hypothetical protein
MRTPAGLQALGKALWKKITGEFDLENEPDRLECCFQACKTAEQIADLDDAAAEAPLTVKGSPDLLGAQSAVEWNGERYAIDGDPKIYNGSRRTAHLDYVMIRK